MADLIELSQESLRKYRCSLGSVDTEQYKNTLYVAISENNEVSCAYNPVILGDAYQCFLIHCKSQLAVTNWYNDYKAEFIDHNGYNLEGIIGNDCYFNVNWVGQWSNQVMKLYHRDEVIYSCRPPFEGHMQGLWDAYRATLNREQENITVLRAELTQKEELVQDLENQVNHYRQMLARIREIVINMEE